jgi:hypothetical protein
MIAPNSSQLVAIFGMTDATPRHIQLNALMIPLARPTLRTEVVTVGD